MARTLQKGRWAGGLSRIQLQIKNNLGIIDTTQMSKARKFRDPELDNLDAYYENRQYDHLQPWEQGLDSSGEYIEVRKRKPRVIYNIGKVLVDRVAGKLVGQAVFPQFTIEEDDDDTAFLRAVQKLTGFKRGLMQPMRHMLISGSVFVRYYLSEGQMQLDHYNAKYCYPQYDPTGELAQIEIKYVYKDEDDRDATGDPKKKWFRMLLTKTSDILFDNPEYREGVTNPQFNVVEQNDHNLGWVQGEWFRTQKHKHTPDGRGIFADILDIIDDINYSLSQSSTAVSYNQEPLLTLKGIDEDEVDRIIRASQKALNLGREGEAKFVESSMKGVQEATNLRGDERSRALEVARVCILDPEKIVGSAQSGKAMEVLNGPLVELIDELRQAIEPCLVNLLIKMAMTLLEMSARGLETALDLPAGYMPKSLDITVSWPPIFPLTIEDLQKKVAAASQAAMGNLISRETLTRWLAKDFGVDNVEEELSKLSSQPQLNPFGSFGGGGFG